MWSLSLLHSPLTLPHPSSLSLLICTFCSWLYSPHGVFHSYTASLALSSFSCMRLEVPIPSGSVFLAVAYCKKGESILERFFTVKPHSWLYEGKVGANTESQVQSQSRGYRLVLFSDAYLDFVPLQCLVLLGNSLPNSFWGWKSLKLFNSNNKKTHILLISFPFFVQESSESTNTTIEDEDTKGIVVDVGRKGTALLPITQGIRIPCFVMILMKPLPWAPILQTGYQDYGPLDNSQNFLDPAR